MPEGKARSKTQQRLMGKAYSVKKGETSLSDIDKEYREEVKGLVDGMTLKQLKDFADMGADGFLIGEYLMSSDNLKKKTIEIIKKWVWKSM